MLITEESELNLAGDEMTWVVDLVTMSMGVGQMRYLVLAREDLTNQVEGRARVAKPIRRSCCVIFAFQAREACFNP